MRIFLTGASGFLGSHSARELVRRGHEVTALMRSTSSREAVQDLPLNFVTGQLPQQEPLGDVLDVDAVVHVAGAVKALSEEEFFRVNERGTAYLVNEVLSRPRLPKLFLHISTIAVQNSAQDGDNFCIPAERCHPLSAYGRSKRAAELALEPLRGKMRVIILRPPVLYGPGDRELLPLFKSVNAGILPVYRAGTNKLSVCYVEDAANAVATLVESSLPNDEIYCLDSGETQTWRSMGETLSEIAERRTRILPIPDPIFAAASHATQIVSRWLKRPAAFSPDKMKEIRQSSWVCGHEKLKSDVGWKPKVKFREGAERTLQAYREAGWIRARPHRA